MRRVLGWGVLLLFVAVNLGACASMGGDAPAAPSLYKRLGGREGIALVVGDFTANMAADPRVNARFKDMKAPELEKFKSNLADQICDATGGPCSYLHPIRPCRRGGWLLANGSRSGRHRSSPPAADNRPRERSGD